MDSDKTWTSCKAYFKEVYAKQKRYNKATRKIRIRKRGKREREKQYFRRQNQGNVLGTE